MFKVGDKVRAISGSMKEYTGFIKELKPIPMVLFDGDFTWIPYSKERLEPVKQNGNKMKRDRVSKFEFSVTSETAIDFFKIEEDLSYSQPLAIIRFNNKIFAVIHSSIFEKVSNCRGSKDLLKNLGTYYYPELKDDRDINRLIQLIKDIKAAPYKKKHRQSGKVEVILPNV